MRMNAGRGETGHTIAGANPALSGSFMHLQPVFGGCETVGGGVAAALFRDGLCLPSGSNLSADDLSRVVAVVRRMHTAGTGLLV